MLNDDQLKSKLIEIRCLCGDIIQELNRRKQKESYPEWKEKHLDSIKSEKNANRL